LPISPKKRTASPRAREKTLGEKEKGRNIGMNGTGTKRAADDGPAELAVIGKVSCFLNRRGKLRARRRLRTG